MRSRPALVVSVLAACGLAVSLMQTLVVPLLPRFPQLLGASPSTVTWLVTATLVAGAVCAPMLGRLGDMYGKRRMLVVALALVAVGSALGAVAPDVGTLIVARALQGASLGVIPLGISIMRDVLPEGRVGSGVALMSSSLGIGGAIGLPLTGVVAEQASWRWLFGGAAVLGALLVVGVLRWVDESPVRAGGRFELRSRSPMVDLRVSVRPAVLWTNVASVLIGFAMFAGFLVTTQVLQAPVATGYGFGLSLVLAGLVLLPIGGAMGVFSPVSARLSARFGARTTLLLGTSVLIVGNAGMAAIPGTVVLIMVATTVSAIGAALAYSALPLLIMDAVPATETAAANSLNALMRMLGTSSCSAVAAAVVTAMTQEVGGRTLPSASAYTVVFLAAAGAALLATLITAATPRRSAARSAPVAEVYAAR